MDRKEKLRELYILLMDNLDPLTIVEIVLNSAQDFEKFKQNLDFHYEKMFKIYDNYLELIPDANTKLIALRRIKDDFQSYHDLFSNTFNENQKLIRGEHSDSLRKLDSQIWIEVCKLVNSSFFETAIYCVDEDKVDLEFELIGATPTPRKNKPTKEQKLALNQNELMYLFMKLGAKDIFTKPDKTHLARGIEALSGFSANKTREKGTNLKLAELENIKTILDGVSAYLNADITQSKAKTKK